MTAYSISVRLRRVTTECVHVRVPIDESVMKQGTDSGGFRRLDMEKLMAAAARIGADGQTRWESETHPQIIPHPIQTPSQS
jgi:hypothetical protein